MATCSLLISADAAAFSIFFSRGLRRRVAGLKTLCKMFS